MHGSRPGAPQSRLTMEEMDRLSCASYHDLSRFVSAIAGCVKFSECEHPERTEHAVESVDRWIDHARKLVR